MTRPYENSGEVFVREPSSSTMSHMGRFTMEVATPIAAKRAIWKSGRISTSI